MPGSFFLDSPVPPKLDLADARGQLFQSPKTPSPSSSLSYSLLSGCRKRSRCDDSSLFDSQSELASPPLLANTDYRLAFGSNIRPARFERQGTLAELDYRPSRYRDHTMTSPIDTSVDSLSSTEAAIPSKSLKRSHGDSPSSIPRSANGGDKAQLSAASLGRAVMNIVGRMWNFCCSGPFRGFHAGGGRGYDLTNIIPPDRIDENALDHSPTTRNGDVYTADIANQHGKTYTPGNHPEDEIQKNWVVIPSHRERGSFNDLSPATAMTARTYHSNPGSLYRQRRPGMSRMGKRTVVSSGRPATPNKSQTPPTTAKSPLAIEAQRHVAKVRRIERENDASIRRLNKQLRDMIRQGKEALGTRVEIEEMEDCD